MEFSRFKVLIAGEFGINLSGYKEKQLKRRIDSLMNALGYNDYEAYFRLLKKEAAQWQVFLDRVTINVSEFFRNPEIFRQLEEAILPVLLKEKRQLKIWSAACSNGAEPYSVAIILDGLTPVTRHKILATDMDTTILAAAKKGLYDRNTIRNVSPERKRRYFTEKDGKYQLAKEIMEKAEFKKHDLLVDNCDRGWDLIICRNVTIYFTPETQDELYRKFHKALSEKGVLFIGATESILRYQEFGFKKIFPWFYGKA